MDVRSSDNILPDSLIGQVDPIDHASGNIVSTEWVHLGDLIRTSFGVAGRQAHNSHGQNKGYDDPTGLFSYCEHMCLFTLIFSINANFTK